MDLDQVISDATQPEHRSINLPASLRISMATALAYGMVYAFLLPRAWVHHVPLEYVSVGLPQLLAALLVGILVAFAATPFMTEPFPIPDWLHSRFVKTFVGLGVVCVAFVTLAFLSSSAKLSSKLASLVVLALCVVAIFVAARRSERDEALANQSDTKRRRQRRKQVSDEVYYLVVGAALLLCAVTSFSVATATLRFSPYLFVVAGPYKDYALVWTANDLVFLQRYDIKKQEFTSEIAMVKIEKENDLRMSPKLGTHP
jgi:hypothetical protein